MVGACKAFALPLDYVLYEMSYSNLTLYSAAIPRYTGKSKEKDGQSENDDKYKGTIYSKDVIKADDPANKDKVRQFLQSLRD